MEPKDVVVRAEQAIDDRSMRIFELLVSVGALATVLVLTAMR
jgi:hypothetical protein